MSTPRERLDIEIHKMLDHLAEAKQPWIGTWITNAIIQSHDAGLSDDPDNLWWEGNCRDHVADEVRRCINKRAGDPDPEAEEDDGKQPPLPGYEHLHVYYRTKRWFKDGVMVPKTVKGATPERVGVHIENMTDGEIMEKARLYRRFSRAVAEHADEFIDYLQERQIRRGPIATPR